MNTAQMVMLPRMTENSPAGDRWLRVARVRDRETIDSELRLLAAVRRVCREQDGVLPSIGPVGELLDETYSGGPPTAPQRDQPTPGTQALGVARKPLRHSHNTSRLCAHHRSTPGDRRAPGQG